MTRGLKADVVTVNMSGVLEEERQKAANKEIRVD